MYQVGTEGGFLPAVAVHTNGIPCPLDLIEDPSGNTANPDGPFNLLLAPAERADVVIDFNGVAVGSMFILFGDAPSPAFIDSSDGVVSLRAICDNNRIVSCFVFAENYPQHSKSHPRSCGREALFLFPVDLLREKKLVRQDRKWDKETKRIVVHGDLPRPWHAKICAQEGKSRLDADPGCSRSGGAWRDRACDSSV